MHILLIPIAVPAAVAAIFALALGGNPVRAGAWGAIAGTVFLVTMVAYVVHAV
jgi:hypothetical protein